MNRSKFSLEKAKRRYNGPVGNDRGVAKKRAALTARLARKMQAKADREDAQPTISIKLFDAEASKVRRLRFGQVVVTNAAPDAETVRRNVDAGRKALARASEALTTPGVRLALAVGIPRFRADASQPGMLVRELNGEVQRGRIVDGAFVPAD